jgi:hypothetical protein
MTTGELFINGERHCYTLEDPVREVIGANVDTWKIPKTTAIPSTTYAGKPYPVAIESSARFKRKMVTIKDVPGFAGIRVHSGTLPAHTEGCILLAFEVTELGLKPGTSALAVGTLESMVQRALSKKEKVTLEIYNITEVV